MATYHDNGFIADLEPNEIFVFGSNKEGQHLSGAARQAHDQFGAIWGMGFGLQGQSYAIPTMDLPLEIIGRYIAQFVEFARLTPGNTYFVTAIGTGIAGFSQEEMEGIWGGLELPANVKLV